MTFPNPCWGSLFLNSPMNTTTQGKRHQISLCSCSASSFLFVLPLLSSVPWYLREQKPVITKFSSWLHHQILVFLVLPQPLCKGELVGFTTQIFHFCSIFRLTIYAPCASVLQAQLWETSIIYFKVLQNSSNLNVEYYSYLFWTILKHPYAC